jgi:hypothetical protein
LPIDIATDEITEIWIGDASCAVAWTIDVRGSEPIASVANPDLNPAYAAQNRFGLHLEPYEGLNFELRAMFVFPTLTSLWTWPIHVAPVPHPTPVLRSSLTEEPAVEGCDVVLTLGNGWEERGAECGEAMKEAPSGAIPVAPDEPLEFGFDSWLVTGGTIMCGRLSGLNFVGDADSGCASETQPGERVFFVAPATRGRWTVALSGCAFQAGTANANTICGTWYANIEVR